MYPLTTATTKLLKLHKRIRGVAGGASASKTVSILMWLIDYAQSNNNLIISVVSETFPHLKRGAMRDFLNIMKGNEYYLDSEWNRTDFIYTFKRTNSIIEFFSADQEGKVKGPRRNVLFINEAINIDYETYTQLEIRTSDIIWLDWNPSSEYWFYTELKDKQFVDFIVLTYKDNEALPQSIVDSLESKRQNKNWWAVYGEGQLGEIEAQIYPGWQQIDQIPEKARFECGWLDFGYTNDPTAAGGIYYYNGWYILDEWIYATKLSNYDLYKLINPKLPKDSYIVADSAEPKSIDELIQYGLNVIPSTKGADSVTHGIQLVQEQKICVTKRSLNVIKEQRNYLWMTNKDGKIINIPSGVFNHHMDGIRYAFSVLQPEIARKPVGYQRPLENTLEIDYNPPINKGLDLTQFWDAKEEPDMDWKDV